MVLLNDGTLAFAAGADPSKHTIGTCSISYRNLENPTYLKVSYKDTTLTVSAVYYKVTNIHVFTVYNVTIDLHG